MKHGKAVVAALLGTMLMVTGLSGCGSREVSDTNDGEFKDAVAELTAELKADYGEDACAAFGIN